MEKIAANSLADFENREVELTDSATGKTLPAIAIRNTKKREIDFEGDDYVNVAIGSRMQDLRKKLGKNVTDYQVFLYLLQNVNAEYGYSDVRQIDIARDLEILPTNVSKVIKRLCETNLIRPMRCGTFALSPLHVVLGEHKRAIKIWHAADDFYHEERARKQASRMNKAAAEAEKLLSELRTACAAENAL